MADWHANLQEQGYTRIVSVLLAFQWSDPAAGEPWTRSSATSQLLRNAGHEIAATFATERLVRQPDFCDQLSRGRVGPAGPIELLESQVLGGDARMNVQAELLGKAIPVIHPLNSDEREVLLLIGKPVAVTELLERFQNHPEAVLTALGSLIQRGLVLLM